MAVPECRKLIGLTMSQDFSSEWTSATKTQNEYEDEQK
jgi:hypothetical protein